MPALVAGAFSLAPKLYDIATEPRAELTFRKIIGPAVQTAEGRTQILSVSAINSGKRPVTDLVVAV